VEKRNSFVTLKCFCAAPAPSKLELANHLYRKEPKVTKQGLALSMKIPRILSIVLISIGLFTFSAQANIIPFDLQGKAGEGLLAGNENGTVVGNAGSGGEVGAGIFLDDVTLELTINIAWGSGNGFTDLTGDAQAGHIHGLTSPAPAGFTQDAGVLIGLNTLAGWTASASSGGFNNSGNPIVLTSGQATDLVAGRMYINIHTSVNSGGEIRGHLVAVPEPSTIGLFAVGAAAWVLFRRRRA
jgi:hypothetical protein